MNTIIAYTDGACKGNGKAQASAGGFGAHILFPNGDILDVWGGDNDTTNNRMELMGAITALERTPKEIPIQVWTDSAYVQKGISEWMVGWKRKNWKKADGKPVLNQDLWIRLDDACQHRQIDWRWIKGHAGHAGNEVADKLANQGVLGAGESFTAYHQHSCDSTKTAKPTDNTPPTQSLIAQDMMMNHNDFFDDTLNNTHDDEFFNQHLEDYYTNMAAMPDESPNNFDDAAVQHHDFNNDNHDTNPTNIEDNLVDTVAVKKTKKKAMATPMAVVRHTHQNPDYDGRTDEIREPFWAVLPDPINHDKSERQLIMDTETTGFDPETGDRVVEIGIVEMVKRKPTGVQLHVYLNPDKEMDEEVISVHGIRNEFLVDKPRFSDVAPYVYEFMKGAEIIAHNATFDMKFLSSEFKKVGMPDFAEVVQVTDSLMIARKMYPGQKNNLDALAKRLDVGQDIDRSYHGALKDSQILLEVYLAMTSGQIAMNIEEESANNDGEMGEISFIDLSGLSGQLIRSKDDFSADGLWRENVLK